MLNCGSSCHRVISRKEGIQHFTPHITTHTHTHTHTHTQKNTHTHKNTHTPKTWLLASPQHNPYISALPFNTILPRFFHSMTSFCSPHSLNTVTVCWDRLSWHPHCPLYAGTGWADTHSAHCPSKLRSLGRQFPPHISKLPPKVAATTTVAAVVTVHTAPHRTAPHRTTPHHTAPPSVMLKYSAFCPQGTYILRIVSRGIAIISLDASKRLVLAMEIPSIFCICYAIFVLQKVIQQVLSW
jgi:hypothetical protein